MTVEKGNTTMTTITQRPSSPIHAHDLGEGRVRFSATLTHVVEFKDGTGMGTCDVDVAAARALYRQLALMPGIDISGDAETDAAAQRLLSLPAQWMKRAIGQSFAGDEAGSEATTACRSDLEAAIVGGT